MSVQAQNKAIHSMSAMGPKASVRSGRCNFPSPNMHSGVLALRYAFEIGHMT
jgi:hypothetical protein